jgi:hypothetical protein
MELICVLENKEEILQAAERRKANTGFEQGDDRQIKGGLAIRCRETRLRL